MPDEHEDREEHQNRENEHAAPADRPRPSAPPTEAIILKSSD